LTTYHTCVIITLLFNAFGQTVHTFPDARFGVLTAVKIRVDIVCVMTSCIVVIPKFQRSMLLLTSVHFTQKTVTVWTSETLVYFHITWRHNPQHIDLKVQVSWFHRLKCFKVGLNTILHRFYPWLCSFQMQLYRCSFFGSPGYVDRRGSYHKHILQKTDTHNAYNRQPSFESFHQSIHLSLVHTAIAILSYHSSVNFICFYTLWPQKSNHISL
jgi:hypothetical protein